MAYTKPSIPKGTRDFLPDQVAKRKHIFSTIEKVFKKYGFLPIETPVFENLTTLTGRYGDEGDKLLFKVLNNGEFLNKADSQAWENKNSGVFAKSVSKRGMRYDLTVPFARYVVMHRNDIQIPFKRYQIQPVWRADRPQKGRYQEFYQCDADVVGSKSLLYEGELVKIYREAFAALGIPVNIHINNRKVLLGLAEVAGIKDQFIDMTTAIDKLDKIGLEGVNKELVEKGVSPPQVAIINNALTLKNIEDFAVLFEGSSEEGLEGVNEIKEVFSFLNADDLEVLNFDVTLARGLSYYTGCIFEVKHDKDKLPDVRMGSIGGGGRYNNLTESFGLKDMPGVGISFGAERIYDIMQEMELFPDELGDVAKIIFVYFDKASQHYAFACATAIRNKGIAADIYPEASKIKKQMKYANDRGFKYVGIIGDDEIKNKQITVKKLETGEQQTCDLDEIINLLID